jgi:hypothetical protein
LGTALLTVSWLFTDVRFVERMNVPVDERLTALSEATEKEVEQPK